MLVGALPGTSYLTALHNLVTGKSSAATQVIAVEMPAAAGIPQRLDNGRQAYQRSAWISVAGHGPGGHLGVVTEPPKSGSSMLIS